MTGQVAAPQAAVEPNSASGDTGSGFLVGTEPAQPRTQVDWTGANAPTGSPQAQVQFAEPQTLGQRLYTDEDIARVRQEEKQKLYDRIQDTDQRLKQIEKEREEVEADRQKQLAEAEAERKRKEEEAMTAKQLVEQVRTETDQRLAQMEQERANERALFEKEREFTRLEDFKRDRIAQESQNIMPELREFITGNSEEQIEQSIARAAQKTAEILGQVQQNTVQYRQDMVGVSPTGAAPVGPMEQATTNQTMTSADIAGMDMETYKQNRGSLLGAARNAYYGQG